MENATNIRTLRMKDLPSKVGFQPSTIYGVDCTRQIPQTVQTRSRRPCCGMARD